MKICQTRIEKLLTTLLKMALHGDTSNDVDWKSFSDAEWKDCYNMAVKHGVMAVAFDGIMLLETEMQPSRPIRLSWAVAVKNYEARYERYCKTASELSSFYADNGISMIQLKGVGLSSYYPVPSHREGGDIDIYTCSQNLSAMSDKEANMLADQLIERKGISVKYENKKHSNFHYNGIPIENHKTFLDIDVNRIAGPMDQLLKSLLGPREVDLCGGKYSILVPSPDFNALFLSCHAARHYCEGMRLHHIFDWACMLKLYGLPLSEQIIDRKLLRFIYSLTDICNCLLGTNVEVPNNMKMANEVYEFIMHPKFEGVTPNNKIGIFFYKTFKFFYIHYMQSRVYGRSLFQMLSYSILFHITHPETIFSLK